MNILISAYFLPSTMEAIITALQSLPSELRPDRFTADEEAYEKAKGEIADRARFKAFTAKNSAGFFLLARRARYNVYLRPRNGFSNVEVDFSRKRCC